MSGAGPLFARARMVCHCLLVEGDRGLVLVDTGLGRGDIANPMRLGPTWVRQTAPKLEVAETAHARVEALGHRVEDVTDIVLTHLDLDHAGGIGDFPGARVHVHRREHTSLEKREGTRADFRYIQEHVAHGPRWSLFDDGGDTWFGFGGVRPLPGHDDVLLVPLPGHTFGHTGVAVRTETGWLFHAGDGYFHHGQLAAKPRTPWALGLFQKRSDMDRKLRVANQARLRELALREPSVQVICAHDPVELDRYADG